MKEKHPFIRLATEEDYPSISAIWMQDHVLRWMSFDSMSLEKFNKLRKESDVYVLLDIIEGKEQVVGIQRIKYLTGKYSHIAEFCSLGVDINCLRRGYGQKITEEFEKIVSSPTKQIKRIQLTQSGGNVGAFSLSDNNGYQVEATFPDWLQRDGATSDNHYYVLERFCYKLIDEELKEQTIKMPDIADESKLPILNGSTTHLNLTTSLVGNRFIVSCDEIPVLEFDYYPDTSVISHIAFLDNITISQKDAELNSLAFRKALQFIAEQGLVKKLEIFSSDCEVIQLCQELGYWVRGQRVGSVYEMGQYKNELGMEYSFFGFKESIELLQSFQLFSENSSLEQAILKCNEAVQMLIDNDTCDYLGGKYLENMAYQMIRDSLNYTDLLSLPKRPWKSSLSSTPELFLSALQGLNKELQKLFSGSQSGLLAFFNATQDESISAITVVNNTSNHM